MDNNRFKIVKELKILISKSKALDRKVIIIFISVAVLQTISWYYTSRRFFRYNFFNSMQDDPNVYLIEYLYWFIGDFFTFFILPVLIIKFLLKEKIRNYGLRIGDYNAGIKISILFLMIMLPLIWFFSATPEFSAAYPQLKASVDSWDLFFIFEAGLFIYLIAWEFIWRGFMLFGLEEKFGYYAIFIQMIPFLILHNGKPVPEAFGAIIAGLALGVLAYRTRSIFYCVITHACIMFSIDFISILRYRSDNYGVGISSLIQVIKQIFI
jgi:membrane protease YdiL (CAAX protease family)